MRNGPGSLPMAAMATRACGCPMLGMGPVERNPGALYWLRGDDGGRGSASTASTPQSGRAVCHVSFYEADAFARWSSARLPTEYEWEAAAQARILKRMPARCRRSRAAGVFGAGPGASDLFGNVWNGRRALFFLIRDIDRQPARSANIMASSWRRRWCCAVVPVPRRAAMSGPATAILLSASTLDVRRRASCDGI